MRWEMLFADLEAEFEAVQAADLAAEVADRTRREVARLRVVDRLRPALGHPITCWLLGAGVISGRLAEVGSGWLLIVEAGGHEAVLPLAAVLSVSGLGTWSSEPGTEGRVRERLGLPSALRAVARTRAPTTVVLVDGSTVVGTVDRVGADFVEIAEHPPGEQRRPAAVVGVRTIPLAALALVRSS